MIEITIFYQEQLYNEADKQSIEIAMKLFSEEVEEDILKHGDSKTAHFISLVRHCFLACDE